MSAVTRVRRGKLSKITLGLLATAMMVVGSPSVAGATEAEPTPVVSLTAQQEADMRQWWTGVAVPVETQDALITNIERGILPQSTAGSTPISTIKGTVGGVDRTLNIYADGSRSVVSVEVPDASGITTRANPTIGGCSTSGSWRLNCEVRIEDAVSAAYFRIDYRLASGAAEVRDFRGGSCINSVGSCQVYGGGVKRAKQSGTAAAWAELSFKAWIGPVEAVNGAFGIRVLNTSATTYR